MKPPIPATQMHTLQLCCRALDDKKALFPSVIDVRGISPVTDFLVIATATSEPHLRALRVELEKVLDAGRIRIAGRESSEGSGWMVVDLFDVMIHLFDEHVRDLFQIESLWADGEPVPMAGILAPPEAVPAPARKRKAARRPVSRKKKA